MHSRSALNQAQFPKQSRVRCDDDDLALLRGDCGRYENERARVAEGRGMKVRNRTVGKEASASSFHIELMI